RGDVTIDVGRVALVEPLLLPQRQPVVGVPVQLARALYRRQADVLPVPLRLNRPHPAPHLHPPAAVIGLGLPGVLAVLLPQLGGAQRRDGPRVWFVLLRLPARAGGEPVLRAALPGGRTRRSLVSRRRHAGVPPARGDGDGDQQAEQGNPEYR